MATRTRNPRRRSNGRRTTLHTGTDTRYVRRSRTGQFKESDDQGASLRSDRRRRARKRVKSGHGDRGDRKASATRKS